MDPDEIDGMSKAEIRRRLAEIAARPIVVRTGLEQLARDLRFLAAVLSRQA